MNIAFIGLGGMGGGMARNLIRHGHSVIAWNRSPEPAAALHAEGVRIAATPAEAASAAEIAITMLANDEAVKSVTLGANGLAGTRQRRRACLNEHDLGGAVRAPRHGS